MRILSISIPVAAVLALAACSSAAPAASGAAHTARSSSPSAAVATGTVSTEGVCGLVPIAKVDSILGRAYVNSKLVPLPAISIADASYCEYTTASGTGEFVLNVATSDPADATASFNEASGNKLTATSGIGDSALYYSGSPELLVVFGQTTIVAGQQNFTASDSTITEKQLMTLVAAAHAAG